ncbi:hypothetical protein AWENTII_007469 [Aspergillus wentii]|nr:hypothetical protein MW887_011324 [Aspergillus wentii]
MSGPAPVDDPLEISGEARRPGRPELPHPVTTTAATGLSAQVLALDSAATGTVREPTLQRVVSATTDEISQRSFAFNDPLSSRQPPAFGAQAGSQPIQGPYPTPTLATSPSGTATRALPQKPTRRTKAHVASACVNCKKKHLGCDPARPCRRCVVAGKAATCVDVTHKKRGRPPLKAEEPSLRPYATQLGNPAAPGEPHQASQPRRTHMHRATSSREIRPMTDLQVSGGPAGAIGLRASAGHPQRWSTSVFPHTVDPSLSMQGHLGHRRFSSSGSHYATAQAPGFIPMTGGFSPVMGAGRMPPGMGRPLSSYANQVMPPTTSPPQYHQAFGGPISPYMESSRPINRPPMGDPPMPRDPHEAYIESPVRLPPIFPAMTNVGPTPQSQGHRLSDPYPAPWSYRAQDEFTQERRPPPPQGLMEPLSPHTQFQHATSESVYPEPVSGHPGPIPPVAERHHVHLSPTHLRDEQPGGEGEAGEGSDGRPTKRRKMALDDMVND